ncbi:MAG: OmpA family protein [Bacteroidota bacterium]
MRKAYIFLLAFIAWAFLFWWHYVYNIKQLGATATPTEVMSAPTTTETLPPPVLIGFKPKTYGMIIVGGNEQLLDTILSEQEEGQLLQITGLNTAQEQVGLDFDLGMARAAELKKLLLTRLPEDQIEIYSDIVNDFTYTQDSLVDGIFYEWVDGYTPIVDSDYYLIDHANKRVKTELFETLLTKIADQLKTSGDKVIIRGHTDDSGDKELNFTIALRNAKDIRDIFRAKGVDRQKIETTSRGEEFPIADNTIPSGREANRRIEIEINAE